MDNRSRIQLLFFVLFFCAVPLSFAGHDEDKSTRTGPDESAESLYKSAFPGGLSLDQREAILREVVQKHPDAPWVQDALWVLARLAEMQGKTARAILWRRRLIEDYPNPSLRSFTTEQVPYRNSRIPGIIYLAESSGMRFAHNEETVFSFNPLPFSLHEELARTYQRWGYYDLAERHFREALTKIPPVDALHNLIADRLKSLGQAVDQTIE